MSTETSSSKANGTNRNDRRNTQRTKNFHHRYLAMCRSKNFQPLPEIVKPKGKDEFLDVYGDRFKGCDWQLIVDALRDDKSLQHLALRLRKTYAEGNDGIVPHYLGDGPGAERTAIMNKRMFKRLIDTLAVFLKSNRTITSFTLEGFPLVGVRLTALITGLHLNNSLTELNLARCSIRDEGCEAVCAEIKFLPNLQVLNLTACHLTAKGCQSIADVVRFQKIQRYASSWERSLRYRDTDGDKVLGLRYLYLSHNPTIGDYGLLELTDVLKEDAWVRQVHVCNCGLTDVGAQFLIECLNLNGTIEKFDIRENNKISNDACHEILVKLGANDLDDGSDSPSGPKKCIKTMAGLREHCENLELQLETERNRNAQLGTMVDQLHMQLGDYATHMNELQRELNSLIKARNELLEKVKKLEGKSSRKASTCALRKTQSEAFAPLEQPPAMASKSEMIVKKDAHSAHTSPAGRVIERSIGDWDAGDEQQEDSSCKKM
ncbi:protein Cep78 homolog [Anopheles nili]|uniref:protein Cep78 homolog n=1 Tax=Anopheles nili TaxID=185578 RepID=UPI00237B1A93|nr:protein Cep78 homolog [Anopheles nili]